MLQPLSDYCACCQKCLANEPAIRCEVCNNQICNDCRAIDNRKRTIIATSLTKAGGGKQPSGRLLTMLGSKLSVLSAFRSGLSKGSFEFDELEEDEPPSYRGNRRPQDQEFDRYFDKSDKHSERQPDRHTERHTDRQSDRHPDRSVNRHNKIEKQLSFQYASERRRRLSARPGEGGSLDIIDNSLQSGLLAVPIDQQQSRSDSQLNRTKSIDQPTINKAASGHFEADLNNNLNPNSLDHRSSSPRLRPSGQLSRMISLDATSARRSPHMPLERSNTIEHESAALQRARLDANLKPNDFILSICMMCAKQM